MSRDKYNLVGGDVVGLWLRDDGDDHNSRIPSRHGFVVVVVVRGMWVGSLRRTASYPWDQEERERNVRRRYHHHRSHSCGLRFVYTLASL
jgi:hypothetical protein